jgi:PAS domain S-box-containing protein
VAACLVLAQASGIVDALDRYADSKRFELGQRPATGQVVVIEIDPKSLRAIGVWPWPRRIHADLLRILVDAGFSEVAFDVDFSQASNAADDRLFEEALEYAGGSVILPAFYQLDTARTLDPQVILTRPLKQFAEHAWTGIVNANIDATGETRSIFNGVYSGDIYYPAMSEILTGWTGEPSDRLSIDFSIHPDTIPRLSYSDVLNGSVDLTRYAGAKIIVGASAIELQDRFNVPVYQVVSGPVLQALATESILQGRLVSRPGPLVKYGGAVLIILIFGVLFPAARWQQERFLFPGMILLVELSAIVLQGKLAISLPTSAWHICFISFYVLSALRELDFREIKVGIANMKSRNTERLLSQIMADSFDGVIIAEHRGPILAINPAGQRIIFGGEEVEVVSRTLTDVLPETFSPAVLTAVEEATSGPAGKPVVREIEIHDDSKNAYIELITTVSMLDGTPPTKIVTLTFRDVTQRRQAELVAEFAAKEAIAASQAKSNFLASVSHELRTPLNAIIGFSEIMKSTDPKIDLDSYTEYADHIHESGSHLLGVVNSLIDVSRIEADGFELHEEIVDLNELVSGISRIVAGWSQAQEKHISYHIGTEGLSLICDRTTTRQMLLNLISNSVKFTGENGIIELRVRQRAAGDLEIVVSDNGIGIASEDLQNITKPFFQANAELARQHDGVGLGLAIVSGCARAHGGEFIVESVPRVGTKARVIFPKSRVHGKDTAEAAAAAA